MLSVDTIQSHFYLYRLYIYSLTAHTPYIQTLPYTHIPAVGPTPNALTSSLSPPLASSPPPASLRLKWSQESNTATMSGAAGEKRSEMGRERATEEGEKEQEESTNTSLSPLLSATHKKMSFWLDTKEPLYPPPLSSMFLLSAFLCYAFFFSLTSLPPLFLPL